jgi:hypothetical protein
VSQPTEKSRREAVNRMAEQITKDSKGQINSEKAFQIAKETAQRANRKKGS